MELEQNVSVDAAAKETRSSMRKAGLFFFLAMLLEIPVAVIISIVQGLFPSEYETLISIFMTQGYLLLAAIVYCLIAKLHPVKDLQMKKYKISTFFLSLVVLITAMPMASWLNVFSQLFAKNGTSSAILSITQTVPMWLGVLIIGCLPGFIEETLYRGIMYSAFRKRSVLTGVVISALAFGLMHMNFNQMAYAIYLGIVFALLVEVTGSLVSTMVLHMLFNALNTAYMYILPKLYEFLGQYYAEYANFDLEATLNETPDKSQLIMVLAIYTVPAIIGIVLTVLLLKAIAKINGRELTWAYIKGNPEEVKQTKPVNVCLLLGFAICLVFCILNM